VWLTLVSDLAQTYFELLALDVRLQIARNSKDAYQRTYDLFFLGDSASQVRDVASS